MVINESNIKDLANFIQSELHEYLPGHYFSPEDVESILIRFNSGERMKETIIKITKSSLYGLWYSELIGLELNCIYRNSAQYDVIYKGFVRHVMIEDAEIIKEVK